MKNTETVLPSEHRSPQQQQRPASARHDSAARRLERRFHRSMYLAIQLARGRRIGDFVRRLRKWDELDAESYERLARVSRERILAYARERVPMYRGGAWQAALAGQDARDIRHWPLLDRRTLKEQPDELLADGFPRALLYTRRSSASTGTPVEVAWNLPGVAWTWAGEYHPMLWHGLEAGARTLRMWGRATRLENWVLNRHYVPAHRLSPDRLDAALEYIERRDPEMVWGTPSAVHELARYAGMTRAAGARPAVPYAKVGGEQLFAFQRDEITRNLGARVIESYGCTEAGPIAAECRAGALHLLTANVHLEIFRDGEPVPPGEFGEIVVTPLVNRAMPLVRCRIGDQGAISPEPCICGLPQPVLAELRGRAADLLLKPDGTPVHGSVLGDALHRHYVGDTPLGRAQKVLFEQLDRHTWKVQIEAARHGDAEALDRQVADLMRETFGEECRARTEIVASIPREASGKFRYYRPAPDMPSLQTGGDEQRLGGLH